MKTARRYNRVCDSRLRIVRKIKALELSPYNRTFGIYDASLSIRDAFHDVTVQTINQGFSRSPGSYNFYTLSGCMSLTIEVWLADQREEIALRPDTVRAIMVPFSISKAGIMIADLLTTVEELIQIPEGEYALVFEIKLRDDAEYLSSSRYQEYGTDGFLEESCTLTFYPRVKPVLPEILRVDVWTSPPPSNLQDYSPLNPTYPLLMEIGLP